MGVNSLGGMMSNISVQAGLSKRYTNHCARATTITNMDRSGHEGRHITKISGHASEASLEHYVQWMTADRLYGVSTALMSSDNAEATPGRQHPVQQQVQHERAAAGTMFQFQGCTVTINNSE